MIFHKLISHEVGVFQARLMAGGNFKPNRPALASANFYFPSI
jgi:hypothetical protein